MSDDHNASEDATTTDTPKAADGPELLDLGVSVHIIIPVKQDKDFGDGSSHLAVTQHRFRAMLLRFAGGYTASVPPPHLVEGADYRSRDVSILYTIGVRRDELPKLLRALHPFVKAFGQECLFVEWDGRIRLLYRP
jgi:hypothetical protein